MRVSDIQAIRIKLASPEDILSWSHGEVTKAETINYRTLKPEKDGLFCERIFGPTVDYQCYCGKYRRIRYKGVICDRCGVEVTSSSVRRERMGHIKLAVPVCHIWFLRGVPSRVAQILGTSREKVERVVYFAGYIITKVDEEKIEEFRQRIEQEYEEKVKEIKESGASKVEKNEQLEKLRLARERALSMLSRIKEWEILSEREYRDMSLRFGEAFKAGTGAETLYEIFKNIDLQQKIEDLEQELKSSKTERKKLIERLKLYQGLQRANLRPEWMFLKVLPVLPPDLRPMIQLDGGRYATADLNDLYRRVINRNNRLKYLLEISAPDVIVRNEKRMLQEAVDALIDNEMKSGVSTRSAGGRRLLKSLADMLKGKKGRFRKNLLGKRVDYSGRSVIVVGPHLKLSQVGIPKDMALELFKPFVINKLLEREIAYNTKTATRMIEEQREEVWSILDELVRTRYVLLNRAPTLHRISIQAFQPILIEDKAIQLHPLVCAAFNADFDGDQMAVHLPLSKEAQREAREIMLSSLNLFKPATGRPIVSPSQDIVLGCYWASVPKEGAKGEDKLFSSLGELLLALENESVEIRTKIRFAGPYKDIGEGEIIETTPGTVLFNDILPEDFPFVHGPFTSKRLEEITWQIVDKYGVKEAPEILDKIKTFGFEYATLSGISLGMDDMYIPPQKREIIKKAEEEEAKIDSYYLTGLLSAREKIEKKVLLWEGVKSELQELLKRDYPRENPFWHVADSGARGGWTAFIQLCGMKGLVKNPAGETIEFPVKGSYKEGLKVLEYFISTHGARKGTADTALKTSTAGDLTRRLVDATHGIIVQEEDCGDTKGFVYKLSEARAISQDFAFKIVGRVALEDIKDKSGNIIVKKGEYIDWQKARKIEQEEIEEVRARSPLSCKVMGGVCQKCYGWDLGRNEEIKIGEAVGVVSAQSVGEPGTQLTLRTFHTGGVVGRDITMGLPRAIELFEVRTPKIKAVISEVEGVVKRVEKNKIVIEPRNKKIGEVVYSKPEYLEPLVKTGDNVQPGTQLCEGAVDPKELYNIAGSEQAQRYLIREIQAVYNPQGAIIHDKHLEIIVRQMFSMVEIVDPGDTSFLMGEIVEKRSLQEELESIKKEGGKLPKYRDILLGITQVALNADSFLAAASFQQTSRHLIKAAVQGKEDKLRGLKENVIIGRLIPAGTGFRKKLKEE